MIYLSKSAENLNSFSLDNQKTVEKTEPRKRFLWLEEFPQGHLSHYEFGKRETCKILQKISGATQGFWKKTIESQRLGFYNFLQFI